jgi:hypothetical protein
MPKGPFSMPAYDRGAARTWSDRGWPVLAGVLVAVAFVGLHLTYSLTALVLAPVGVWCVSAVMLYGLLTDGGTSLRSVLRIATIATTVVLTFVGLLLVHPTWGWVAAGVGTLSSPPVTRAAHALTRRRWKTIGRQATSPADG